MTTITHDDKNARITAATDQAGNFAELVTRYQDSVFHICCLYLGDRILAEDALQETFLKAYTHYGDFQGKSSVKTWLTRIAINTCKSCRTSSWSRRVQVGVIEEPADLSGPELPMLKRELQTSILEKVMALPVKYKEVIILYYYQEMNCSEISQVLRISESSVKTRLMRARKKLHSQLEGVDFSD